VLRSVTLSVAMSVLAAACGLVQPPPPPDTRMVQIDVRNMREHPTALAAATLTGPLPGAAQPALLHAHSTATVTFYIPSGGDWWIKVNEAYEIQRADLGPLVEQGCAISIELQVNGLAYTCNDPE
jgi:hypothetical protein